MDAALIVQIGSAVLAAVGGAGIVQAVARRRNTKVDAVNALNATTLDWAEQLKADAREAREQAREVRRETAEVRAELAECRREAQDTRRLMRQLRNDAISAAEYVTWLVRAIREPDMTIERLRALAHDRPPPAGPVDPVDLLKDRLDG